MAVPDPLSLITYTAQFHNKFRARDTTPPPAATVASPTASESASAETRRAQLAERRAAGHRRTVSTPIIADPMQQKGSQQPILSVCPSPLESSAPASASSSPVVRTIPSPSVAAAPVPKISVSSGASFAAAFAPPPSGPEADVPVKPPVESTAPEKEKADCCSKCFRPLGNVDSARIEVCGKKLHSHCFCCRSCGSRLSLESKWEERSGDFFCEAHSLAAATAKARHDRKRESRFPLSILPPFSAVHPPSEQLHLHSQRSLRPVSSLQLPRGNGVSAKSAGRRKTRLWCPRNS